MYNVFLFLYAFLYDVRIFPEYPLKYLLAEGEGFEPSNRLLRYTRSRRASSTTPAPFLVDNYTTTLLPLMVALTDVHSL